MLTKVSYNVVIERFKAFADGHYLIRRFSHGQIDVTDIVQDNQYPWMHIVPVSMTPSDGAIAYEFDVIFADLPRDKEVPTEYQRESLSDCIRLAEDLISEIKNGGVIFGTEVTLETGTTIEPFIEEYTHTLTGVNCKLSMQFPNDWSACEIPADWSAGGSSSGGTGGGGGGVSIVLRTNGTDNAVQTILDLTEGSNMTITDLGDGRVQFDASGDIGATWGTITGILANQTDLQNALDLKADIASLAAVATSGDYNDLSNLPTIPSIDGLVPYTGASSNVNLGDNKLITDNGTDNSNVAPSYLSVSNAAATKSSYIDMTGVTVSDSGAGNVMNLNAGGLTFPDASSQYTAAVNADWNATSGLAEILNKPTLPPVIGDMTKAVYDTDDDGVVDSSETIQITVRNSTGSTLLKGQVVYLSGATGNRPNALLADASTEATSSKTIGFVLEDIADNADGQVVIEGTLHNLDTSSFSAGDLLWLSETAGAWQANTPPSEPAHAVFLGYVARSHPTLGRVILHIQNGYELDELHNVVVPSPTANDYLYYDGTTSLWRNRALNSSVVTNSSTVPSSDVTGALNLLSGTVQGKVTSNAAITPATATKITYDAKGLVTSGTSLIASDLPSHTHTASQISNSTTVGQALVTLANPNAISYLRVNADNSVSALTLAQLKSDIGLSMTVLASDVSITALNTNLNDVTGLSFPIIAGNTYKFTAYLVHTASVANVGLKWAVNADVAVSNIVYRTLQNGGVVTAFFIHHANALNSASTNSGATQSNQINTIDGILVANNTGTAIIRFGKSQANAGTLTVKAGSFVEYQII